MVGDCGFAGRRFEYLICRQEHNFFSTSTVFIPLNSRLCRVALVFRELLPLFQWSLSPQPVYFREYETNENLKQYQPCVCLN